MKEIPLTLGKAAMVDDCDYATVVAVGKWSAAKRRAPLCHASLDSLDSLNREASK